MADDNPWSETPTYELVPRPPTPPKESSPQEPSDKQEPPASPP